MEIATFLVVGGAVLLGLALALILWRQGHPEETAGHEMTNTYVEQGPTPADYPSGSRPAGPDAEEMNPDDLYLDEPEPPPSD